MLCPLHLQQLAHLALICFLFLSINLVNALPLRVRQNGATTVQTVHTTQTIAGPLTETCVITLTPITDKNGQPAVEEVKKCSLAYGNPDGGGTGGSGGSSANTSVTTFTTAATAGNTALPTATDTASATSITGGSSTAPTATSSSDNRTSSTVTATSIVSGTSSPTATTTSASSSALPVSGIHVNGVSTVAGVPTQTGITSSASGSPTATTSPTTTPATTVAGTATPDASASASAAAAEQPSQSPDAFQLPGKKLSVLPIGLGVFAGISVIALIVVGLVTYERTKYRKAFRQRKLAESGATMGYGGMAQRS